MSSIQTAIQKLWAIAINSSISRLLCCALIWIVCTSKYANAQKELEILNRWIHYSDAPNALYHFLEKNAETYFDIRTTKISSIHSVTQWKERQQWIQKTLQRAVGTFPEKTPLNARILKVISQDDYRIENIIFESQPGYYVTASLFIPSLSKHNTAPAIVYCSGHANTGYRLYQKILVNLVKKGFVVLAFDPISQGERIQYYDQQNNKPLFQWPAWEHSYVGAQLFITGNTLARNFIWDGIRAVDYLITRKEVDTTRLGITGRSGGGTQSAYIAAMDKRIKAAAPENYITNFKRLYQSIGPQDAEQNLFYGIREGLDMADLLAVRAPKSTLVITTTQDMFPIQGAEETTKEVAKIYQAYGKEDQFAMVSDDAPHTSTKKNREAMYAFFQKSLNNPGNSKDEDVTILPPETLQVTPTDQVNTSYKAETAFSLNTKDAQKKIAELAKLRLNDPVYYTTIVSSAKRLSGYKEPGVTSSPIFLGRFIKQGYSIEKYIAQADDNAYIIPYLLLKPEKASTKAVIYLNPLGKLADTTQGSEMEWFVKNGFTVLAPDIVGTGEMGPGVFKGDSYIDSISYNTWFSSMLVDKSILGIQCTDVVKLIGILQADKNIKEIYGFAKKQLAPVMLHAAAFSKDISSIVLMQPYSSYRSIVMNEQYNPGFLYSTVPGAIGHYDLPDLAASLAPRKLLLIDVTDGNGNTEKTAAIEQDLAIIRTAYNKNAPSQLKIIKKETDEQLKKYLKEWIIQ